MAVRRKNPAAKHIAPACRKLLAPSPNDSAAKRVLRLPEGALCLVTIGLEDTPAAEKIRTLTALAQRPDGMVVLEVHYQHLDCTSMCAGVALDLEQIEAYASAEAEEEALTGPIQTRDIPGITTLKGTDEGRFKFSVTWMALILERIARSGPEADLVNATQAGIHLPVYPIKRPYHPHDAEELKKLLCDESPHHFDPLVYQYVRELQHQLA